MTTEKLKALRAKFPPIAQFKADAAKLAQEMCNSIKAEELKQ